MYKILWTNRTDASTSLIVEIQSEHRYYDRIQCTGIEKRPVIGCRIRSTECGFRLRSSNLVDFNSNSSDRYKSRNVSLFADDNEGDPITKWVVSLVVSVDGFPPPALSCSSGLGSLFVCLFPTFSRNMRVKGAPREVAYTYICMRKPSCRKKGFLKTHLAYAPLTPL